MESEQKRQRRRRLEAVARNVMSSLPDDDKDILPEVLPTDVEDLLWDYAMGLLDPPEEEQVTRLLACSERAEQALVHIRQSMAEAGMPNPIEVCDFKAIVERVVAQMAKKVAAMGRDLATVCEIVVRTGDGLLAGLQRTERAVLGTPALELEPVLLGDQAEDASGQALQRIEIQGPEGMTAAVLRLPDGRIDIDVTVSDPPIQGRIELFQLEGSEGACREEFADCDARLKDCRARLEKCPEGILKIRAPDGREMILCIAPAEEL